MNGVRGDWGSREMASQWEHRQNDFWCIHSEILSVTKSSISIATSFSRSFQWFLFPQTALALFHCSSQSIPVESGTTTFWNSSDTMMARSILPPCHLCPAQNFSRRETTSRLFGGLGPWLFLWVHIVSTNRTMFSIFQSTPNSLSKNEYRHYCY